MSSQRSQATIRRDLEEIEEGAATAREHLLAIYKNNARSTHPTRDLGEIVEEAFRQRFAVPD